jgi:hypothetical protein
MKENRGKPCSKTGLFLCAVLFAVSNGNAQNSNLAPSPLTDAQARVLIQSLTTAQSQNSGSNPLTAAQAQMLIQYLAAQSQTAAGSAVLSGAQGQALMQSLTAQGQPPPSISRDSQPTPGVPGALTIPPGLTASALGPKKPGVIRIGVFQPKAQMGQGNSGGQVAQPIQTMIVQYLSGPAIEPIPLVALIPSQEEAEAKQKECDFVIYSSLSQKKSGGGGLLRAALPLASMIPMVGMAAGVAGAVATTAAASAAAGGASVAGTVRAKNEVSFDYQLIALGDANPVLSNSTKAKAKTDGEDVITPLIEQAATAIVGEVTKKK